MKNVTYVGPVIAVEQTQEVIPDDIITCPDIACPNHNENLGLAKYCFECGSPTNNKSLIPHIPERSAKGFAELINDDENETVIGYDESGLIYLLFNDDYYTRIEDDRDAAVVSTPTLDEFREEQHWLFVELAKYFETNRVTLMHGAYVRFE